MKVLRRLERFRRFGKRGMVPFDLRPLCLPKQGSSFRPEKPSATAFARVLDPTACAGSSHDPGMQITNRLFGDLGGGRFLGPAHRDAGGAFQTGPFPLKDQVGWTPDAVDSSDTMRSHVTAFSATPALNAASCFRATPVPKVKTLWNIFLLINFVR